VIEQARTLGYTITVHEGYQWEEKHRTLEPWAYTLWKARAALHPQYGNLISYSHDRCRDNAYHTIKRVALLGVGKFASKKKSSRYLRPDWWALVVGRARATMFRRIEQLRQTGHTPVLVYNDGIFFVSENPDPVTAVPGLTDKWDKLGGYKHEYTLPIDTALIERFHTLSPGLLIEYLNEQADNDETDGE
jgi:hypothetical protein